MIEDIPNGLYLLMDPTVLLFMAIGVLAGIMIGALPGLTSPMALGLMIPLTFGMEAISALLFLLGIHFGAIYGGAITAILINTPGTPAGAAAALDGYPLTKKGQSKKALQMAAFSAFFGATLSVFSLIIFAPLLAKFAIAFGPSEYFALGILGLSVVAGVAGRSLIKALIVAVFGVFISTIGHDSLFGVERFTFGSYYIYDGIDLVIALIGLFAVSQILIRLYEHKKEKILTIHTKVSGEGLKFSEIKKYSRSMTKGGLIGVFIGSLPGTGAVMSSFFSYSEAVRSSKNPEKFGKGELEGVAAAESGSNGTESAAMIPLLTFGIPGDVGMAVFLGALLLHGVNVGPELFTTSGDFLVALFAGIIVLEILIFLAAFYGSGLFSKAVTVPEYYLFPVIAVLVMTGSYALFNDIFFVWVALAFGLFGFLLIKLNYPIPPLLLGIILGPIIENNFLLAMSSTGGNMVEFLIRPITATILVIAVFAVIIAVRIHRRVQKVQYDE